MGMAKVFGFFPTIYEEYNKKQVHVDSRYFIYWDHSQFNNKLTIHAHTLSLLSPHTRSNLYTSLQYKLNYTLCSLKYLFNYRGEQTHFKGKRTQGEYVSIRENWHNTVLTWEQFDWKSGGGKEDLKKKLFSFVTSRCTVIILYTYIYIYNTARRFNSIFIYMHNFSKQTYGLHFYFQHAFGLIIYFLL